MRCGAQCWSSRDLGGTTFAAGCQKRHDGRWAVARCRYLAHACWRPRAGQIVSRVVSVRWDKSCGDPAATWTEDEEIHVTTRRRKGSQAERHFLPLLWCMPKCVDVEKERLRSTSWSRVSWGGSRAEGRRFALRARPFASCTAIRYNSGKTSSSPSDITSAPNIHIPFPSSRFSPGALSLHLQMLAHHQHAQSQSPG